MLRLRAVGDVMLGTSVPEGHLPPNDGAQMLAGVAELLKDADLTFANMEGPLCDSGTSSKCRGGKTCYAFRTPTSYAQWLSVAGIDLASTANNHSGDFGEACRRETEKALDGQHIVWSGPPGSIATTQAKGRTVALVAFHTSGATNDVRDVAKAVELVKTAAAKAELVVVSFHGGAEGTGASRVVVGTEKYLGEDRGDLRKFAHAVVDAGADLVLGHGPHVLRALELYQGRLVAYSLGNFATYGRFDLSGPLKVGAILEVELAADGRFVKGQVLSTVQEGRGVPAVDPKRQAVTALQKLTALDFPQTALELKDDGTLVPRL